MGSAMTPIDELNEAFCDAINAAMNIGYEASGNGR